MAGLFRNIFNKVKHSKDQPQSVRDRPGRATARNHPHFADPESYVWPAKSPYDVVTEPKPSKGPQSCPGGTSRGPPLKRRPTANVTVVGGSSSFSDRDENDPPLEEITNRRPSRRRPGPSSDYGSMGYAPSLHFGSTLRGTLEYDCAELSPSDGYGPADLFESDFSDSNGRGVRMNVPSQMIRMYEKQAQRLRGKSRYYKDQAIRYKQGYEDERLRTQQLKRHLEKETDARKELSIQLQQEKLETEKLRLENERLKMMIASRYPSCYAGAGEAMCSRSDFNTISQHSAMPPMQHLSLNFESESDEVKCFRGRDSQLESREDSMLEQPRGAPAAHNSFSPGSLMSGSMATLKDDGYSTTTTVTVNNVEAGDVGKFAAKKANADVEASVSSRILRRSFSDTDVRQPPMVGQSQEESVRASKPSKDWSERFPYTTKQADQSISFSSDDEQLHKPGDLMRMLAPLNGNALSQPEVVRRAGPKERNSVSQFEFLRN